MYKIITIICIIASLPLIAAIGHDAYMIYMDLKNGIPDAFKLSDIGWIWQEYSYDTHELAKKNINTHLWDSMVVPMLQMTAIYVTLIPALASYTLFAIPQFMKILKYRKDEKAAKGREQRFAFDVTEVRKGDIRGQKQGVINYKNKRR
jgi:hypothetical protein